jgi:hypothetical protein
MEINKYNKPADNFCRVCHGEGTSHVCHICKYPCHNEPLGCSDYVEVGLEMIHTCKICISDASLNEKKELGALGGNSSWKHSASEQHSKESPESKVGEERVIDDAIPNPRGKLMEAATTNPKGKSMEPALSKLKSAETRERGHICEFMAFRLVRPRLENCMIKHSEGKDLTPFKEFMEKEDQCLWCFCMINNKGRREPHRRRWCVRECCGIRKCEICFHQAPTEGECEHECHHVERFVNKVENKKIGLGSADNDNVSVHSDGAK